MPYSQYNTYLSNIEALVFDGPNEVVQTEKDAADELALWTNAQFSFDVKPGVGIYEEDKKSKELSPASQFESVSGLDPMTYNTLVNYLDYELPQRQQVDVSSQTQKPQSVTKKQRLIQPRPLAPALPNLAPNVVPTAVPAATRQVLMPKPPTVDSTATPNILSSLLPTTSSTVGRKRSSVTEPSTVKKTKIEDEQDSAVNPDEDKRRRNTAASARFRVKKKMREQAMEQSVREMSDKSERLQDRINHLEAEIKFLRSLLLNKSTN
ncbi:MAG: hypothetical protein EXX96DRAFT_528747 [Benjaminiella poitrasii]|nr:MAG: hypothetical protein EXX96DRAFT_528747 [Benjaminiella poitrasii]